MAVSTNGTSAIAELDYLQRAYNSLLHFVTDGLLPDMDKLAFWGMKRREEVDRIVDENRLLIAENSELKESNKKLLSTIHEFTQRDFELKLQKKKMERDFQSYIKRVRIALGIIDNDRISGLATREQECIKELNSATNNFSFAGVRRQSTNLADLDESQEASWIFGEGDRDVSREILNESNSVQVAGFSNTSRTRSGRTYSRCATDFIQSSSVAQCSESGNTQRPPKPPRSPSHSRRRSRSQDNHLVTVGDIPNKPSAPLGSRRSRSETRVLEPLASLTRSPSSSLARPHVFIQETVVKSHTCATCGKKSRFGQVMLKCQDCGSLVHTDCRNEAPLPCWGKRWNSPAQNGTPRVRWATVNGDSDKTLTSFVNELPPFVPAIVIQCVQEIEARGLHEAGLYRLSGSLSEIRDLKKQLYTGKVPPNLSQVKDVNVITGVLKDFFNNLPDPVIPSSLRHDFLNALDLDDHQRAARLKDLVKNMTDAHHDTLVYMILHLQRVASHPETNMPIRNLSRVLAPTLFGTSSGHTSVAITRDLDEITSALEFLLAIPSDYWLKQLRLDTKCTYRTTPKSKHLMAVVENEQTSSSDDGVTRSSSTNSAVGHTVRSFFSRNESHAQKRLFTSNNSSAKKTRRNK